MELREFCRSVVRIKSPGEEDHLDAVLPFVNSEGTCCVHATVAALEDEGSTKRVAEVLIDDERVGQLTPKLSAELLPVIDFLAARGEATAACAVVTGSRLKAEVTLHVKRAHEIPVDWFDRLESEPSRPVVAQFANQSDASVGQTMLHHRNCRPPIGIRIPTASRDCEFGTGKFGLATPVTDQRVCPIGESAGASIWAE